MAQEINPRQRIIDHGEVFTPSGLVNDMLDLVAHECERIDSRFLEPACGDGNFLAEVLRRKLRTVDKRNTRNRDKWERDAVLAVCSLYGIDLLPDNIAVCRARLLNIVAEAHAARFKAPFPAGAARAAAFILSRNIVQGNALTLLDADGQQIVFSEWSPLGGNKLKRRDFRFGHLLGPTESSALFGKGGGAHTSDRGENVFVPEPVGGGGRPPCHYLNVADGEVAK